MADSPLRFLHASDFQLDQPLHGVTEVPEHLREVWIDAAYRAAERVFDTAVEEKAAFVCLTGEVFDAACPTSRALAFVRDQFQRMDDHGIAVYWSVLQHDESKVWPEVVALPERVHCFSAAAVEAVSQEAEAGWLVRVLGLSGADEIPVVEFTVPTATQYCIAVANGRAEAAVLGKRSVDYWALGGRSDRKTLLNEPTVAHYAGSPQGRSPRHIGPHGCTLVEVRRPRETRCRFIPCDVLRWQHQRVLIAGGAHWSDVQELLAQRVGEMRSQVPTIPLLVRWTLAAGDGSMTTDVLRDFAAKALDWLKKQYGHQSESCWPVAVQVDAHEHIPASCYEEDTLLGDYLRSVRALQEQPEATALRWPDLPASMRGELEWIMDLSDAATHQQVLREAAGLGAALLRGEKGM